LRGVRRHRLFRSWTLFVQAVLLASCGNTSSAGVLRSTDITRRPHYYDPLRSPLQPAHSYGFPQAVVPVTRLAIGVLERVSQVPRLICRCPPSSIVPESPAGADTRCFPAGSRLRHIRKVGHSHGCNETESGSLALRLTSSPSKASPGRIAPAHARLATWRTSAYHG
jgi:hypothetical protein